MPVGRFMVLIALLILPTSADACRVKLQPWESHTAADAIAVIGRVLEVRVMDREAASEIEKRISVSGAGRDYEVIVEIERTLRGTAAETMTFTAGGCGVRVPEVGDLGLFVADSSGRAVPLYESEGEMFLHWLEVYEQAGASN